MSQSTYELQVSITLPEGARARLEIELGKEPEKPTPADIKTSDL